LSTKYNESGDDFRANVLEDVYVGRNMVVPRGTEIRGEISYLKRPGRIRGRAQMNLRFDELRLPDGRYMHIEAKVVELEPRSAEKVRTKGDEGTIIAPGSKGADAKRVGKSSGIGALIGVLGGGKSGAAVGAGAGAVAGLASILMTRGRDAVLESGTEMTIELMQDIEIPERP
jgi:type IV secretion system protein VirB10